MNKGLITIDITEKKEWQNKHVELSICFNKKYMSTEETAKEDRFMIENNKTGNKIEVDLNIIRSEGYECAVYIANKDDSYNPEFELELHPSYTENSSDWGVIDVCDLADL